MASPREICLRGGRNFLTGGWSRATGRSGSTPLELELELIQTQMTQKPMLRAEVYAQGLARVSKNAGGRPRLASVAFDGRYMGLAL